MDYMEMSSDFFCSDICILCLESHDASYINIYSEEGKQLGVQEVIVKYFWLQPNEKAPNTRSICRRCWNSVYSFHEFYLQVECAHEILGPEIPGVYPESIMVHPTENNVYTEYELVENDESMGHDIPGVYPESIMEYTIEKNVYTEYELVENDESMGHEIPGVYSESIVEYTIEKNFYTEDELDQSDKRMGHEIPGVYPESIMEDSIEKNVYTEDELYENYERVSHLHKSKQEKSHTKKEDSVPLSTKVSSVDPKKNGYDEDEQIELESHSISGNESKTINTNKGQYASSNCKRRSVRIQNQIDIDVGKAQIEEIENKMEPSEESANVHNGKAHLDLTDQLIADKDKNIGSKLGKRLKLNKWDEHIEKNFTLTCSVCHIVLPTFTILKRHFRSAHQLNGYAICCNKKFFKRSHLNDHIKFHKNPETFKCPHCSKILRIRASLRAHMKRHEEKHERKYQCETCLKRFDSKTVFTNHLLVHTPEEQKTISCLECEKKFATQALLERHQKTVHQNVNIVVCDVCGKSLRGKEAFERHMDEHAGTVRSIHVCEICGSTVKSKYNLSRHKRKMHSEANRIPQTCKFCGIVSPTLNVHRYHVYYVHKLQRIHACTFCDKSYKRAFKLKEHMKTHTGEGLYSCAYCSRIFNSKTNMYTHQKRIHPNEWEKDHPKNTQNSKL